MRKKQLKIWRPKGWTPNKLAAKFERGILIESGWIFAGFSDKKQKNCWVYFGDEEE